jgi:hypothetical protein
VCPAALLSLHFEPASLAALQLGMDYKHGASAHKFIIGVSSSCRKNVPEFEPNLVLKFRLQSKLLVGIYMAGIGKS